MVETGSLIGDIQRSTHLEPLHQIRVGYEGPSEPHHVRISGAHSFVSRFTGVAPTDQQGSCSLLRQMAILGRPGEVIHNVGELGLCQVDVRQVELIELCEQVREEIFGVCVGPSCVVHTEWRDSNGCLVCTYFVDDSVGYLQQEFAPVLHGASVFVRAVVDGVLHERIQQVAMCSVYFTPVKTFIEKCFEHLENLFHLRPGCNLPSNVQLFSFPFLRRS
ncbi:hypothetical protein KC19_1G134400 [Ceratodon purpureus]|uniref:Uncharacterized protein n=1 Tax=Ceratodon purpureus TaxID=3225 RepID=A0A8T0J6T8_CERPU|nr:hypothetical protein KC19_1G134400 [Ceratodon purpureus]